MLINNKPCKTPEAGVLQSYIRANKSITLNYLQDIPDLEFHRT
jgi:hypothetical protein